MSLSVVASFSCAMCKREASAQNCAALSSPSFNPGSRSNNSVVVKTKCSKCVNQNPSKKPSIGGGWSLLYEALWQRARASQVSISVTWHKRSILCREHFWEVKTSYIIACIHTHIHTYTRTQWCFKGLYFSFCNGQKLLRVVTRNSGDLQRFGLHLVPDICRDLYLIAMERSLQILYLK